MTTKELVHKILSEEPATRELKNRSRVVWYMLHKKYIQRGEITITKGNFSDYYTDILSITRYISWWQSHYPELRGTDYPQTKILAQEKKLELGYEEGFYQRSKKLQRSI